MNKIIHNKDFLFSSSRNVITNLEQDNNFDPLNIAEDKSFSDLNFFTLGNQPLQFSSNLKNDYTMNSLDSLQPSKKSELENFAKNFGNKTEVKNHDDIDEIKKNIKNNIPIPFMSKCDFFEKALQHIPLISYGDYNSDEKIMQSNEMENGNENELTNQNSGIFCSIHKTKVNKFRKKIKFIVLNSKKYINESSKKRLKKKKYAVVENKGCIDKNIAALSEKIINKKYKYKCEHPGCKKTFKTLKLKLNRHDISDCHCKKDIILLLYMISNTKNIIKKMKRKNNIRISRVKKLYKKCIFSLRHKDYAINIAGSDLIN